ncbi:CheR family methyltransferase [Geomonas diazotrophica]|nr:CheR family methyltransferase [Geomonas nitrogeniifigens]
MGDDHHHSLPTFARFIARNMGLHFPETRLRELAQKMSALAREAGFEDLDNYLFQLMAAPLSQEQLKALSGALTIGETYFLRDPKSYRVLERQVLPALIDARRRGGKTLKIWSAGCATGEEPYSIAIILSRLLQDLPDWKITLLGTDINEEALERAQRGVYGKWSFRNAPEWLMEYFTPLGEGQFEVAPRIRQMVHFSQMNLAADAGNALTGGVDIIFCRNVMLYFHAELIEKTVARFHAALKQGGWLFVGPTEVDHQKLRGFNCHYFDGALLLRKGEPRRKTPQVAAPAVAPQAPVAGAVPAGASPAGHPPSSGASLLQADQRPESVALARAAYHAGEYHEAARLALSAPHLPESLALAARCYANLGRYQEAREQCEKALLLERLDVRTHYLLSMILEQLGDDAGAEASLKRALYLDHDYLLAYFALGNLCRKRGEFRDAAQSFANALRLLQRHDPAEVLPEAEGITAGMLTQLIKGMIAGLNRR